MRFVVLTASSDSDVAHGYDVRIGPMAFVTLAAPPSEELGPGLETSGAVLVPADPRPRGFKLAVPIRGAERATDPRPTGYRLRRQLRQLLNNRAWMAQGFYWHWEADAELDGWIRFGGGELTDEDQGVVLGEWSLELSDCYIVGRPSSRRLGRRLELADRRSGLSPLDTRGVLYSTDHGAQALPARPLIVPGDTANVLMTRNRLPSANAAGPLRGTRRLWRELAAVDGDVASFLPDDTVLPLVARQYLELEDVGSVRVWDTGPATVNVADPSNWSTERDTSPELMGFERVLGTPATRETPLAVDNGVCRLVWLGRDAGGGLALEYWDDALGHYHRLGRLAAALNVREVNVVELTAERAVLEWRGAERALRVVLQRGWYGPRLEAYNDAVGGTARLELVPEDGAPALAAGAPAWVDVLTAGGQSVLWAKGTDADVRTPFATAGTFLNGAGVAYEHTGAVVAQLGTPAGPTQGELASLAIADVQPVPVLLSR